MKKLGKENQLLAEKQHLDFMELEYLKATIQELKQNIQQLEMKASYSTETESDKEIAILRDLTVNLKMQNSQLIKGFLEITHADLNDISEIAVCGSGTSGLDASIWKGFLISLATLMTVSNFAASSAVGSRYRYTPLS